MNSQRCLRSPVSSFSGGFLCWLGSQLSLQLSALCILSETLPCLGLWRTGGLWTLREGQRPESQVLQKVLISSFVILEMSSASSLTQWGVWVRMFGWSKFRVRVCFPSGNQPLLINITWRVHIKTPQWRCKELAGLLLSVVIFKVLYKHWGSAFDWSI